MCPECGRTNTVHTVLHNFRLERILGVGGMSIVLQARDLVLNRNLAVKVLKDSYRDNPERVARFEKECALMARVRHPNVVSVYSAGEARGQFYIAMELVEGQNLELMVSPIQPMAPLRALSIVRQVARGLNAANKAGLLHRDIKPGNVLVTRSGRAKVLDFGLSLGKEDVDTEETIWATPFYVPPETLLRQQEDVRTDIYALGMTLRFLLSGCETFQNEAHSIETLIENKRTLERPDPKLYGIDASYADLIAHMTAFDINQRPPDYEDLLQEMEEVREAQRIYEFERSPVGKAMHRKRQLAVSTTICLLGIISAVVSFFICTPRPQYKPLVAENVSTLVEKDTQQLQEAEHLLSEALFEQSADAYMRLAQSADEPAVGAWSAMIARYFADCNEGAENLLESVHLFDKHINNASNGSPAGLERIDQLRAVQNAATKPDSEAPRFGNDNKILSAFFQIARMQYFASKIDKTGVEVQRERVAELLGMERSAYSKLAIILKSWNADNYTALLDHEPHLQEAIKQQDFVRMLKVCDLLLQTTDPLMKRRYEAYHEMAQVGAGINALLQKKFPSAYSSALSIEKKLELLQQLNTPHLVDEIRTYYHFLQSDLSAAAASNPYRYIPDSAAPFALLASRWLVRLAPTQNINYPHSKIHVVSSQGIAAAKAENNKVTLSNGEDRTIVANSEYSMTLQVKTEGHPPQLVDYQCMYGNYYCELPKGDIIGRWIDVVDGAWRGPCYLQGNKLIHPKDGKNVDVATILHRDEKSLFIRWNGDNKEAYYVREAYGIYVNKNHTGGKISILLEDAGKTGGCVESSNGKQAKIFYTPYVTRVTPIIEKSENKIIIKNPSEKRNDAYTLDSNGGYKFENQGQP